MSEHRLRPLDTLWLAVWSGLMTGLIALSAKSIALMRASLFSPAPIGLDIGWLYAPLVDAMLFGGIGVAMFGVSYVWPRLMSLRTAAFTCSFLGLISLLVLLPRLSVYSILLLACGIAVQAARLAATRAAWLTRLCRLTTPWLLLVALALPAAGAGAHWASEWKGAATSPARRDSPNVLFIVLDTVRARSLSVYGHSEPTTPWLERFAMKGVLFEHAFSTSPWTLPSHATLFTGRLPGEVSATWDVALDEADRTLGEIFSARGYLTAGFVANYDGAGSRTGLDRGFHRYDDHNLSKAFAGHNYPGRTRTSSSFGRLAPRPIRLILDDLAHENAAQVNTEFLEWLADHRDRPVFAFLNYYDAHAPYRCPQSYLKRFESGNRRQRRADRYEACIAYLDEQLRLLFEELDRRGFLDNTLTVITSDHGEQFGEHGLMGHGNSLYRELLEVPLILSFPKKLPQGRRIDGVVSLADIAATILDLSGVADVDNIPGASLARFWSRDRDQASEREPVISQVRTAIRQPSWLNSDGPLVSVVEHGFHYIKNYGRNQEELYDFHRDPGETNDLIGSPSGVSWLPHFRSRLGTAAIAGNLREVPR